MVNQKLPQNLEDKFAEKCRIALEKSWGIEIPKPTLNQKRMALKPSCERSTN
jgi:hypothetical protein